MVTATYEKITPPANGERITIKSDYSLKVPNFPIIPFIEGDGTGSDIWRAASRVIDAAVEKAYGKEKKIIWFEVFAGEKAIEKYGTNFPDDTLEAIKEFVVAIKGPLGTPVGVGFRSLNVALRQALNLYACIRPIRYFEGVPAPVKHPEKVNMILYRENTEDVYAGIEWKQGTPEAKKVIDFLNNEMGKNIKEDSGIGIKPISVTATKRLVRKAIQHALDKKLPSVTLVHKGNIMKFTEGAFKEWGYQLAKEEFGNETITEAEVFEKHGGPVPAGKLLIKDRIADAMFQQILLRPEDYSVCVMPNLNGDYMSDAAIAQVGGLGLGPGANIGDGYAVFEATHGTAPKYANLDKINPGSVILSGAMMLEYLGWNKAAELIEKSLEKTIKNKTVTYDLERNMPGAKLVKCSEFGDLMIKNM